MRLCKAVTDGQSDTVRLCKAVTGQSDTVRLCKAVTGQSDTVRLCKAVTEGRSDSETMQGSDRRAE